MPDPVYTDPGLRHDFVILFDVSDGNPNGDPDAGNLPRVDPETMHGLVTDVCLKRKVRNYVLMSRGQNGRATAGLDIYVKEGSVLNREHQRAYEAKNIEVGQPKVETVPAELVKVFVPDDVPAPLPEGFSLEPGEEDSWNLRYSGELDAKEKKEAVAAIGESLGKKAKEFCVRVVKGAKSRKAQPEEVKSAQEWMCEQFYDIRAFGAVLSTNINCGQVRGPLQLTFARSIDPIVPLDLSITRVAVTREEDSGKERGMGRKALVPYGLYRGYGFFNPFFADKTRFGRADLALFWDALRLAWDLDHSASRGMMALRGLYVFSHANPLGNAAAHELFDLFSVARSNGAEAPRRFTDYEVRFAGKPLPEEKTLTGGPLPEGVTLTRLVG
ncbi:MAG TPA: type I-C CRISPR-associated protein Cas7/Csd2 [Gemmataceae bacterium]|nr:type I-C CRISPR-associated protein Cas7/Csd2 [Gemmataceae bacterium]